MKNEKKIICLTPVKNEAWVLDNFIKCTGLWADEIIISDQESTDNSQEIIKKHVHTRLIINTYKNDYDEWQVRNILFTEARKINDKNILIAVDADEVLVWDFKNSSEWDIIRNLEAGTVIKCDFINLKPGFKQYWNGPVELFLGFVDDGSQFICDRIHTKRMIAPENAPVYKCKDIKIMHFQYTDWERMQSKHRWYQCWERVNNPDKSSIQIFRGYNHMYAIKKNELHPVPDEWFSYYLQNGIDLKDIKIESDYYWDRQVLDYFKKYGTAFFKRIDLWYINWKEVALKYGYTDLEDFRYPHNIMDRLVLFWLKKTQYNHENILVRIIDKILVKIFKY